MSSLSVSGSDYGQFYCADIFRYCAEFLEPTDFGRSAQVCKLWNHLFKDPLIWKKLSEREGIPLVISLNGAPRDYEKDFKILYPITISGKKINQFFGKMVGQVPPISEKWFDKLQE